MAPPPEITDLPGYDLVGPVGKGGMGVVYKARQKSMDRFVAVKFLSAKLAKNRGFVQQFVREARATARLAHPNIVLGIDAGEHEGVYYFVMEFVEGRALKAILREKGALAEREALAIVRQVAEALDHAYRHGIVHRDIKPGNILVAPDGTAKVCDMGLAARAGDVEGGLTGTPFYISPEQARGQTDVDVRSDLYSLGATLYHALTGKPPFDAERPEQIIARHLADAPTPPRDAKPEITRRTNDLVLKLLEKDREKRFQSPRELLKEISAALESLERGRPAPRRSVAERYVQKPSWTPLIVLFFLLSAAVAAYLTRAKWIPYVKKAFSQPRIPPSFAPPPGAAGAERGLAELRASIAADPTFERFEETEAALDAFVKKYGRAWACVADEIRAELRGALEKFTPPEWPEVKARADAAYADGRWREAWGLYLQFPARFAERTAAGREAAARASDAARKIEQRFAADVEEFRIRIDAGRLNEARTLLDRMSLYALASLESSIEQKRAELEAAVKARDRRWRELLQDQFELVERDVRRKLRDRQGAEAVRLVMDFLNQKRPDEMQALLREPRVDYERLKSTASKADLAAMCEEGISDLDPANVTLAQSVLLTLRNAAALAEFWARPDDARCERDRCGVMGLHYFYQGKPESFALARDCLSRAAALGYPGAAVYTIDVAKLRMEREAANLESLWASVRESETQGRWLDAEKTLDAIQEHALAPFVIEHRDEILAERRRIAPKADVMRTLAKRLRGAVTRYADGNATIEYDFARREQFEAFRVLNAQGSAGGWTWEPSGWLASSGGLGSAVAWVEPLEGDVVVDYEMRSLEQRNIVTTLYHQSAGGGHYSFILGLDLVMGLRFDPGDTLEKDHGLPRHGIAKFPLPDPKTDWKKDDFWSAWNRGMIGRCARPVRIPRGESVRVRIERVGTSLRFFVGGEEIARAEDGDYRAGALVFFTDSRVRLSDLRITWRVDP